MLHSVRLKHRCTIYKPVTAQYCTILREAARTDVFSSFDCILSYILLEVVHIIYKGLQHALFAIYYELLIYLILEKRLDIFYLMSDGNT